MISKWLILVFPLWKKGGFIGIITYLIMLSISGCSYLALFFPEVVFDKYHRVGVVTFTSDSKGNLNEIVSQEFLKEIRKASKKALIIELGNESKVFESVNETEMNPSAINKIAEKHELDAVIIGKTEIHEIKPQIETFRRSGGQIDVAGAPLRFKPDNTPNTGYEGMRAKFDVDASLNVSIIEAKTLDTVWTSSVREEKTITPMNIVTIKDTRGVFFDKKNSEEAHKGLAGALVQDIIAKLRVR